MAPSGISHGLDILLFLGGPIFKLIQCLPAMHSCSPFCTVLPGDCRFCANFDGGLDSYGEVMMKSSQYMVLILLRCNCLIIAINFLGQSPVVTSSMLSVSYSSLVFSSVRTMFRLAEMQKGSGLVQLKGNRTLKEVMLWLEAIREEQRPQMAWIREDLWPMNQQFEGDHQHYEQEVCGTIQTAAVTQYHLNVINL
ncbi:hypothetical protein EV421DRAFT_1742490 [Armillaria borealis]|uniref:Uncharacterized protein n=1 Tax=Armillaria borealis TaxID=47425 RepID=A0AA39IYK3_9AGAR|nr:hypothetical protein EV421DRAFT_1742490 [Armillaria borealis]